MAPVSLPLGCKSVVRPLVENLFINHANGPGRLSLPPAWVPSAGLFNLFGSGLSFFIIFSLETGEQLLLYYEKYFCSNFVESKKKFQHEKPHPCLNIVVTHFVSNFSQRISMTCIYIDYRCCTSYLACIFKNKTEISLKDEQLRKSLTGSDITTTRWLSEESHPQAVTFEDVTNTMWLY